MQCLRRLADKHMSKALQQCIAERAVLCMAPSKVKRQRRKHDDGTPLLESCKRPCFKSRLPRQDKRKERQEKDQVKKSSSKRHSSNKETQEVTKEVTKSRKDKKVILEKEKVARIITSTRITRKAKEKGSPGGQPTM